MVSPSAEPARQTRSTIRVVIANGEPLFGDAVERVIRQCARFQLVGHAVEGYAALELVRALEPDVTVLGPSLADIDSQRILRLVTTAEVPTRLLFVGDFSQATAYELLGGGAAGVLAKTASGEQLRDAIVAVSAGRAFLSVDIQTALRREIRLRNGDDRPILSGREREILVRIADGESVPVMARALHLSVSTIKTHRGHLFQKLGVSDRAAAVAVAMRRGLIA
jgi:two-component system, NarL family, nitrate/nitrite response regulator NarL